MNENLWFICFLLCCGLAFWIPAVVEVIKEDYFNGRKK